MMPIKNYKDLERYEQVRSNNGYSHFCGEGWFVILLGNLGNRTPALEVVLDNYQLLNRATREVYFFVPGYSVDHKGIVSFSHNNNSENPYACFGFDVNGFMDTVDWLEKGSDDVFQYSYDMELILLPFRRRGSFKEYNFEEIIQYNLDELKKRGDNIITFIRNVVNVVQRNMSRLETQHYLGCANNLNQPIHEVFIAGSKELRVERDGIRAVLAQVSNNCPINFNTRTFEDFERSFARNGRQADYNRFISEEADSVIFIIDQTVGGITKHEFDVAMDSFRNNQRPDIYVYVKKSIGLFNSVEIESIIKEMEESEIIQYYIEYTDVENLKGQVERDFLRIAARHNL